MAAIKIRIDFYSGDEFKVYKKICEPDRESTTHIPLSTLGKDVIEGIRRIRADVPFKYEYSQLELFKVENYIYLYNIKRQRNVFEDNKYIFYTEIKISHRYNNYKVLEYVYNNIAYNNEKVGFGERQQSLYDNSVSYIMDPNQEPKSNNNINGWVNDLIL